MIQVVAVNRLDKNILYPFSVIEAASNREDIPTSAFHMEFQEETSIALQIGVK